MKRVNGSPGEADASGPQPVDLLEAALDLVAEGGLSALTLRPLAERMGTSVSRLTYRIGDKTSILETVAAAAREADRASLAPWLSRIGPVERMGPRALAAILDLWLDEVAGGWRKLNLFFLELVLASRNGEAQAALVRPWTEDRRAAWSQLASRCDPLPSDEFAEHLHAFVIDETSFSLALGHDPSYRLLRRLCVTRLCTGFLADEAATHEEALFEALFAELGRWPGGLAVDHDSPPASGWREAAAAAAAALITSGGVGEVTHRAVAGRVGVAVSTLAYRFATQEALVVGGLEHIIRVLQGRTRGEAGAQAAEHDLSNGGSSGVDIARATFSVALAATRMPALAACAADMRRRRGINLHPLLVRALGEDQRLDRLAAQALSTVFIGGVLSAHLAGSDGPTVASTADAALRKLAAKVKSRQSP